VDITDGDGRHPSDFISEPGRRRWRKSRALALFDCPGVKIRGPELRARRRKAPRVCRGASSLRR
jgi:hypothetical protein